MQAASFSSSSAAASSLVLVDKVGVEVPELLQHGFEELWLG